MDNKLECYELTLTENYVMDWDFNCAVRELIQNGTDQEILTPANKFTIEYNQKEQKILLKNLSSKLNINTLLLGRSTKSNNEETVGQFGEGYKIAALVLNRLNKTFTIYNNERKEIWTTKFKNSEKWKERILAFYIGKNETSDTGLVIEIGNVTRNEYYGINDIWLGMCDEYEKSETQYGEILFDEELKGCVFVNGLSVGCNSKLKYGYNFKPKYIKLERDRKTCDSWNVEDLTSKMVAEAMVSGDISIETVQKLVEQNIDDVYHLDFNGGNENVVEVKRMLLKAFDEQNTKPYSVPVNSQEQINKVKAYGGNPVVVPPKVASLLKAETNNRIQELSKLPTCNALTLKERFIRWYSIYSDKLTGDEKMELNNLINELEG